MQSNKLKLNTEKNWDDPCMFISVCQFGRLWVCRYRWKLHSFLRPLLRTLESILTRHCQWNNTSIASATSHFLHSGESRLSVHSCLHRKACCVYDHVKIGLLQCYFRRCSQWINRPHTKDPEQRCMAYLEKIKAWSCHTAFERTPLAPSKILHSV